MPPFEGISHGYRFVLHCTVAQSDEEYLLLIFFATEPDIVLNQVVAMLSRLSLPPDVQARIDALVRSRPTNDEALEQVAELEEQLSRVQFSWEHGKLLPDEYIDRVNRLEREIASMRPLDYDRLEEAADLITHFKTYWERCNEVDNPAEAREQLMTKIIDRVFVYDDRVIAIALHANFGVILDVPESAPNELVAAISETSKSKARTPSQVSVPRTGATGFSILLGTLSDVHLVAA